jgi:selenide,water dikinase
MLADPGLDQPLTTAGLRVGDRLILTKPLGSGVLLAAHMQARCEAAWMESLLAAMLVSNKEAAELARQYGSSAVTDITGFGLAGHLLEMLRASGVAGELNLDALPLLPGASDLLAAGLESTLAPANRVVEADMQTLEAARRDPRYAALFDPQTCGGLLFGVRAEDVEPILSRLSERSSVPAAVIGQVVPHETSRARLALPSCRMPVRPLAS